MLPVAACAFGICLGLNLNVLVLIPITLAVLATSLTSAHLAGQGLFEGAATALLQAVSCQAGYVVGLTAREPVSHLLMRLKVRQSKRV
ncbi:hypothetical protein [Bradyrhizobium sp.]|uniref:hypothetical protein n=1 Tax=Bradyrhizobium sp. TaxID=376 RepID=UPI00239D205D|nr:hypothetical protein [Bradyrhizobium sp.]MDE2379868.1 hypothetical protein [Bradyrhizobium sp.]